MAANKLLSADKLFALMRAGFEQVPDGRAENAKVSLPDALMSGFAMFSLKDPSLLAFDERRATDSNLQSMYGIEHVPGDTQMRTILDDVAPVGLRPVFKDAIRQLERSKELDKFIFLGGSYLVSLDGTGYFRQWLSFPLRDHAWEQPRITVREHSAKGTLSCSPWLYYRCFPF